MSAHPKDNSKIPVVRIFCDYEAEGVWDYPLPMLYEDEDYSGWVSDKDAYLAALKTMGRCEDYQKKVDEWALLRDLELWNAQFSRWYLDWEWSLDGSRPAPSLDDFDPDIFTQTGLQLAFRMKQHHPDWIVIFFDDVAFDRDCHNEQEATKSSESFWYCIEISDTDEMTLISCDREGNTAIPESSK